MVIASVCFVCFSLSHSERGRNKQRQRDKRQRQRQAEDREREGGGQIAVSRVCQFVVCSRTQLNCA